MINTSSISCTLDGAVSAVLNNPGRTNEELSEISGMDRRVLARLLPEAAEEDGARIVRGSPRYSATAKSKRPAITWWPSV